MPRGDRTGPEGQGPKTGRGLGDCADDVPRRRTGLGRLRWPGRGLGLGLGRGRARSGRSQSGRSQSGRGRRR